MPNKLTRSNNAKLCSLKDSILLVTTALETLKLSGYRLENLLQCPQHFYVHRWASGQFRVSQPYVVRLCRLLLMQASGANISLVDSIDWDTGEITMKTGISGKLPGYKNSQAIAKFMDLKP